ncbi:hypothetical protein FQZ97_869850 [compost metagenome]
MRGVSCDENPAIAKPLCGTFAVHPRQDTRQIFIRNLLANYLFNCLIHARLVDFLRLGDQDDAVLVNTVIGQQGHRNTVVRHSGVTATDARACEISDLLTLDNGLSRVPIDPGALVINTNLFAHAATSTITTHQICSADREGIAAAHRLHLDRHAVCILGHVEKLVLPKEFNRVETARQTMKDRIEPALWATLRKGRAFSRRLHFGDRSPRDTGQFVPNEGSKI